MIKVDSKGLKARLESLKVEQSKINRALVRIGLLVSSKAKLNIRKEGLIDTGYLLNSIRYEIKANTVSVGSFGARYAAVHEFGFRGRVVIPAHTRQGVAVRSHTRQMNILGRPYLRPALEDSNLKIINIIREELSLGD